MNDGIGILFVILLVVAGARSCDSEDPYSFEQQGVRPIVMGFWCGNECGEREDEND